MFVNEINKKTSEKLTKINEKSGNQLLDYKRKD